MRSRIWRWIDLFALLTVLFLCPISATGNQSVHIETLLWAEDASASLGPEAVMASALDFQPLNLRRHSFERTDSAIWLKLRVVNPTQKSTIRLLEVGQARLHQVSLYGQRNGNWREEHGGTARPFTAREIPTLTQVFSLELPAHSSREFLVRVASDTVIIIHPRLWTMGELMTVENHNTQLEFFMAGVVALMLLFGLVALLILREPGFLVFGLASLCFLLFRWSIKGVSFREFWPNSPEWALHSIGFFLALVGMLIWVLHRILLRTAEHFPRLDRVLIFMIFSFALFAGAIFLLPYRPLMQAMTIWGLSISLFSPILGFMAWRKGVVLGGYCCASYVLPWQVTQVLYFSSIGWLPSLPASIANNAMAASMVLASVVILAGLGARTTRLRREQTQTEREQRQQLKVLVSERTAELSQAKNVAEEALASQRQFLAMVSHELRSPVASVSSACELLEAQAHTTSHPSDKVITRIRRAVKRMSAFLDTLLTEDRFESRNWEIKTTDVALKPLLNSIIEQARQTAQNHSLTLKIGEIPENCRLDPEMIRIMLLNLLENAAKYSPSDKPVTLHASTEDTTLVLEVSDRGPGFSEAELSEVFKKYTRGQRTAEVPGTGLGLYIVHQIVELHNGQIELRPRTGGGTQALTRIPAFWTRH